jgi:hypothetical protein
MSVTEAMEVPLMLITGSLATRYNKGIIVRVGCVVAFSDYSLLYYSKDIFDFVIEKHSQYWGFLSRWASA